MTISKEVLHDIRLLVFDLDGTLADTKRDLAESVNAMRGSLGWGPLSEELIASYVGRGVTVLVQKALDDRATPEALRQAQAFFLNYYRQHMLDHTVLYPGVPEALERLGGLRLTVLTNKPVRFSRDMLAGLGIVSAFSQVYGGDSFERKKPDPMGVIALMKEYVVDGRRTMVVGDSDTDVLAGRGAGAWTCGVTYGFGAQSLATSPPDLLLADLRDLPNVLEGKGFGVPPGAG